jgi:hypothetical protein
MLRTEVERKSKGLTASPDPRRCSVDDLLDALEARYKTEGRRSLERLKYSKDQLLRLFKNVAAEVAALFWTKNRAALDGELLQRSGDNANAKE